jgi:hypothetical protein
MSNPDGSTINPNTTNPESGATWTAAQSQGFINMGIPDTSLGGQFEGEEWAAAQARGQSWAQLWAGFKLPAKDAGDFWTLYAAAESFAGNTSWKYLPTPQQLLSMMNSGMANDNTLQLMSYFTKITKVNTTLMPWAPMGLSSTQYSQALANVGDALYETTGQSSFATAGLGAIEDQAMLQGWSSTQLSDYIQKNPTLNKQYGYLQYGQNFQQFSQWKSQNAQSLEQRYGPKYSQAQAIQELGAPLQAFHAQGGVFGESVPYVSASSTMPTGRQSSVR